MRAKKLFFVLMPILLLALSLSLCSCDLFGGNNAGDSQDTTTTTEPNDDTWSTLDNTQDVYKDLVIGCVSVAYQGSEESIRKNGNALTFESKIKICVDKTSVWLALKAKYKTEQPKESTLLSAEVYKDENLTEESLMLATYIYNNVLHISVGKDNKVKIDLPDLFWEQNFFPFDMVNPTTNTHYINIAKGLASYVTINTATVGKYRRSTNEYRYTMDINLKKTLWNVCQNLSLLLKESEQVTKITDFITNLFDIKTELSEDSFPEGSMNLTFETKKNVLSALSFDFTIHTEDSTNMLFAGKPLVVSVVCDKVAFGNDYSALYVPFAQSKNAEERAKYISYRDNVFSLTLPLSTYDINNVSVADPSHYNFRMTTRVFQSDGTDNFVFLEYLDDAGSMVKGVYFYNNKVYFYDDEFLCSLDIFGLGDLALRTLNNDFSVLGETGEEIGYVSDKKFDVYDMLGYVLKSITFSQNTLLFSITEDFFDRVLYSFRSLCTFGNMLVEGDALKETQGILDLQNFIMTNQIIFNIKLDVSFLTTLTGNNVSPVKEIITMLQQADTETEKHLTKSALEIYLESK